MPKLFQYELQKTTDILINRVFQVKEGETVVITADTGSDEDLVNATASSVVSTGGKPMVIWTSLPDGVGKAADPKLPVEALSSALCKADVWIEYNSKWLLYSTPFEVAEQKNKKLRYINLVEMTAELLYRTLGNINMLELSKFLNKVAKMTRASKRMKITNPSGTDVEFTLNPNHLVSCDAGEAHIPGIHMLPGQINVVPKFGSVNGTIVYNGALTPPCGLLDEPVIMKIEDGIVTSIEGGRQAVEFRGWLKSFEDPNMFRIAHVAYGLNPGAKLSGNIVEDERVWGCTEWGMGYVSPYDAPPEGLDAKSHCDGICLNSSVWLDGVQIMDEGKFVHPELKEISEKIVK